MRQRWFRPCGAGPPSIVVGRTPSLLAVCGPLGCLSIVGGRNNRPGDSHLPYRNLRNDGSCCRGDNRPSAVVISPPVVVIVTVVIVAPVVFVTVLIVLPIAVVIFISVAGTGSLGISRSWSQSNSWCLRCLWLHLSDRCDIVVEQIIFAEFECVCSRVTNGAMPFECTF